MAGPSLQAMADRLILDGADPASATTLAGMILDRLQYSDNGNAPVVLTAQGYPSFDGDGAPVSVVDFIASLRRDIPQFWLRQTDASAASPALPAGFRATRPRDDIMAETLEKLLSACPGGNPYSKGGNLTAAVALAARDPARAARLKAEAGR